MKVQNLAIAVILGTSLLLGACTPPRPVSPRPPLTVSIPRSRPAPLPAPVQEEALDPRATSEIPIEAVAEKKPPSWDRQIAGYLGEYVRRDALPLGCPARWVPVRYSGRFTGFGCRSFSAALDMPGWRNDIQAELATDSGRTIGVVLTMIQPSMQAATRAASEFRFHYDQGCVCDGASSRSFDCKCEDYMVRVGAKKNQRSHRPALMVFYYTDGPAFTDYWTAAREWVGRDPTAGGSYRRSGH